MMSGWKDIRKGNAIMSNTWGGYAIVLEEQMTTAIKALERAKVTPNIEPMIDRKFSLQKAEQDIIRLSIEYFTLINRQNDE
jgi:hypothetical protein